MKWFNKSIQVIRHNQRYMWVGLVLLILGIVVGYLNAESIQVIARDLLRELEEMAKRIQQHDNVLYTFWVIFQNNVLASLSMLGLGVFFGIYPALALFSNGLLLGFILKMYAVKGMNPLTLLFAGILPHGIMELFAVILAASVGMKYGVILFRLIGNLIHRDKRSSILGEFGSDLQDLPYLVGMVILLLFIAAVIESTVTPLLIHHFIGSTI